MTASVATFSPRPAPPRRYRAAPPRRGRTPSHAPRRRARPAVEWLESRTLLAADPPVFDTSFGVGGRVRLDVDGLADNAEWVRAMPDGKALVFGTSTHVVSVQPPPGSNPAAQPSLQNQTERFLARLKADGSLDPAFGDAGVLRLSDPDGDLNPPVVQPDGKILIAGTVFDADRAFVLSRYNADGTVDAGFGDHGVATLDLFAGASAISNERTASLALQPDGKIVAVGVAEKTVRIPGPRLSTIRVVRFNADGTPDEAFASHGEDVNFAIKAVAVDRDGRVVVGASPSQHDGPPDPTVTDMEGFTLFRYNADGTEDLMFGQGGRARVPVLSAIYGADKVKLTDLLPQPDGKYAVVGSVGPMGFALGRVDASGALDASFDFDGVLLGRGIQAQFLDSPAGQYRLSYDAADQTLGLTGVGTGLETQAGTTHATGLQVVSARIAADGHVVSAGRVVNLSMNGVESVGAAAIGDDGKIFAAGKAFPTADAGEGEAYAQTADALVARFDLAALPANDALTYTSTPTPGTPTGGGTKFYDNGGSGLSDLVLGVPDSAPVSFHLSDVSFAGRSAVRGGKAYPFRITYPTEAMARLMPVTLTGPGGFNGVATALKVKPIGKRPAAASTTNASATTARPAVASYRVPAPGGKFDASDNGTYAVRLNATAGAAASGQVVGLITVNAARGRGAAAPVPQSALQKLETPWTGVLRGTTSVAGNATGWILDRTDAGAAGQVVDLELGSFPGEAAALSGRLVTIAGGMREKYLAGRGVVSVFVVESIAAAM
jgi:uncharacterized delta-60 repeat protein